MKPILQVFLSLALCLSVISPAQATETLVTVSPGPQGDWIDQSLWWLYQLRYDEAHAIIDKHVASDPEDPAGYFYKAGIDWWHLAQDFDRPLPGISARMRDSHDRAVKTALVLLDNAKDDRTRAKACFYLGGAEGLLGRWFVTQKEWMAAYRLGQRGQRYLKKALRYDPELYDAYLGLGIYDYYTDTLAGVQRVLAAVLIRGDRKRGLRQLQIAVDKGRYSRVEAKLFFVQIYTSEENTPAKALPIARQLAAEFPQSPAMHLARIMTLYSMKSLDEMMPDAQDFLRKSEAEVPFYRKEGVAPAKYCIGVTELFAHKNPDAAWRMMDEILTLEGANSPSRWVTYAILRKGQIHDLRGERDQATICYQQVLKRPDLWGSRDEARQNLAKPFRL